MNEQSWTLTGDFNEDQEIWHVRLRQQVIGQPASVEADWKWALDQEEESANVAGFAHTHPSGAGTIPSERDMRTMQAWCTALGKPLLCIIWDGEERNEVAAYVFEDDLSTGVQTDAFEISDS
jgi:proteasome lid subunit RPN8/RPN11